MSFILNIKTGVIHDGEYNCFHEKRTREANKQYFETYKEAENFYNGKQKGRPCSVCMKELEE